MKNFTSHPNADDFASPTSPRRSLTMDSVARLPDSTMAQAERNGAMPMPVASGQRPPGAMSGEVGAFGGPMAMARSPPKNKNTQHVPCKFFLQGQCQAGRMCPFSHDVESTTRPAPCKYFAKGGCKFGRKCALLHVTPDGTVVNRGPPYGAPSFAGPSGPAVPMAQPPPPGLLSMQAQGLEQQRRNGETPQDFDAYPYAPRNGYDVPHIDMTYVSTSPQYGSPTHDARFAGSPPGTGLSVLDAPLPNSFDSNGISMAARNGPYAASVPSRFGVESPPSSLPRKLQLGNTALLDLHNSAFGDRGMDGVLAGSSPPSGSDEPLTFPKRPLHSQRLLVPRHQMISASLGTRLPTQAFEYSDDEADAEREEDLLPASLHDLIPVGKIRRESKSRTEEESTPASFLAAQRRTISGHGTPQDSKVGSPHSSSPSRYTGMFARGRGDGDSPGHVGSPLRNSGFAFASPSSRHVGTSNGDLSPTVSSPPRQASMSMLTQGLQRTKLDVARSQAAGSGGLVRSLSNGSNTGRSSLDRAVSSQSVGRERIDEEQELFDMDEVGDPSSRAIPRSTPNGSARTSGVWGSGKPLGSSPREGEPTFGAIGAHRTTK